eukprot:CAMPEP_0179327304 /NCGR_PEP_ID=MMETSP0797-20121207/61887_1 /TAXON_ID=47934 /ORGANISM="Dinophysis acuminata, Strain DAEP01" /LENGTH=33 /DNA_ID= /DNA_START= /DNA_END= /DNA_ORIENTATION=
MVLVRKWATCPSSRQLACSTDLQFQTGAAAAEG